MSTAANHGTWRYCITLQQSAVVRGEVCVCVILSKVLIYRGGVVLYVHTSAHLHLVSGEISAEDLHEYDVFVNALGETIL